MENTVFKGITHVIPTIGRPVLMDWANAYANMQYPMNFNGTRHVLEGMPIDQARNIGAKIALESNSKYLFFHGDDVIPPPNCIRQLVYSMENNDGIGVIGGVYSSRSDPSYPLLFRGNGAGPYWDWKVGELFEITGMGMDCTLIRTDVFRDLPEKDGWFKTVNTDKFDMGISDIKHYTEDLYFLDRVIEETKWKVFADAAVICEHVDPYSGRRYLVPKDSKPFEDINKVKDKDLITVLDVGCGEIHHDFGRGCDVTRVDIRDECKPDYRCDIRNMPFADGSYDIVWSSHVLEHLSRADSLLTLREMARLVNKNGELRLVLPNIEWAAENIVKGVVDNHVLNVLYGAQDNPYDYHQNGLTPSILKKMLNECGFKKVVINKQGYNMLINAFRHEVRYW